MFSGMELMSCPDLAVPVEVMQHVVRVESSHNPFAIGVVGGHLVRQPANLPEALATVRMLERRGFNFSLGIAQVNRYNLGKLGLDSYEKAFQLCPNLQAGARILAECYDRSGRDWGKSFSCYYSGNFVTGFRHGYVQKIFASMRQLAPARASESQGDAIPVVSKPSRRGRGLAHYPVSVAPIRGGDSSVAVQAAPYRIQAGKQPEAEFLATANGGFTAAAPVMLQAVPGNSARARLEGLLTGSRESGPESDDDPSTGERVDSAFVF